MSSARGTPELDWAEHDWAEHDWAEVDAYLAQTLLPEDETLELVLHENQAAGLLTIDVSPLQGALLSLLVRISTRRGFWNSEPFDLVFIDAG